MFSTHLNVYLIYITPSRKSILYWWLVFLNLYLFFTPVDTYFYIYIILRFSSKSFLKETFHNRIILIDTMFYWSRIRQLCRHIEANDLRSLRSKNCMMSKLMNTWVNFVQSLSNVSNDIQPRYKVKAKNLQHNAKDIGWDTYLFFRKWILMLLNALVD